MFIHFWQELPKPPDGWGVWYQRSEELWHRMYLCYLPYFIVHHMSFQGHKVEVDLSNWLIIWREMHFKKITGLLMTTQLKSSWDRARFHVFSSVPKVIYLYFQPHGLKELSNFVISDNWTFAKLCSHCTGSQFGYFYSKQKLWHDRIFVKYLNRLSNSKIQRAK